MLLVTASLLALSIPALAAPTAPLPRQGSVIPLRKTEEYMAKRAASVVDHSWLISTKARTSNKYGSTMNPAMRHQKRAGAEALLDESSELWMGPITIGKQSFEIDFDTGSSDLWVPSSTCTTGGCVGHSKYKVSTTAVKKSGTFSISYGDGSSSSGPIYTDTVTIAGVTATSQYFSPVTTMAASFAASSYPADGIAGMGFQALSQTGGKPFFQNMVSEGAVSSAVFSFKLASSGAELYLGGIDSAKYTGAITYTPVTEQAYWTVGLGGVKVGSTAVSVAGTSAIIDTGTTLVYGSTSDVKKIWAAVPGSADMSVTYGSDYDGYWLFPCASPPTISFSFGGKYFAISTTNINLGQVTDGSSQCVGGLVGQDPTSSGLGNTFLVGDVFLQGVYAVFDVGSTRVGFATQA